MSKTYGDVFNEERLKDACSPTWTAVFSFPYGDRAFSLRPLTIGDVEHDPIIRSLGEIGAASNSRRDALQVSELKIDLNNFPNEDSEERFSDLMAEDFESTIVRVYQAMYLPGGSVQELKFIGVPRSPIDRNEMTASVTLVALSEVFLSQEALRTLSDTDFPSIRSADVGATIPIVFGTVPKFPGRVISKGSGASITADPGNVGTGELREVAIGSNAVDEVWTLTFSAAESVIFDSGSATSEVGKSSGTTIGTITDSGGDTLPAIQGSISSRDSDDVIAGATATGLTASFTVNAGGSNRQAFVVITLRGVSTTVTVTGTPTLGGNALTRVGTAITSGSAPRSTIEVWRLNNPSAGNPSLVANWSGLAAYDISVITMANVDASLSFLAADAGVSTSQVALKAQSGPGYLSFGIAISNGVFTMTSGGGQTSRVFKVLGGAGGATVAIDTKSPAATSSGTSSPADPETATMAWNAQAGSTVLGAMFTIRGITGDVAVQSSGTSQSFNVSAPGMTATQVQARLYRDFPTAATVEFYIDGTSFGSASSLIHGHTGAIASGGGSRFLNTGSHSLEVRSTSAAKVRWRGSGTKKYQVSGTSGDCYAQSFQTAAPQVLVGVRVKVRRNSAASGSEGSLIVQIRTNSGSNPTETILGQGTVQVSSTSEAWVVVALPALILSAATKYWITMFSDADATGKGRILWGKNSSGGYSNGNANKGGYSGTYNAPGTVVWAGGMTGEDFKFECVFDQAVFAFNGSVSGAQGTGSIGTASSSSNGRLSIPATGWLGSPAAGDKFYATVSVADGKILFCESPTETKIRGIGSVYYNGTPLTSGGTILNINDVDGNEAVGGVDGQVVGQTFQFTSNYLLTELLIPLKKVGSPPGTSVTVQLVEANAVGTAPGESGTVLLNGQVPISGLTTSYVDKSVSLVRPVVLQAGVPYAVVLQNPDVSVTPSNEVLVAVSTSDPYASGSMFYKNSAAGTWTRNAQNDLNIRLIGAVITKDVSEDVGIDGNVATVSLDAQLPDDAIITADLVGINDDDDGTYTGSANTQIRVPSNCFHWCLVNRMGVDPTYVDLAGSFAETAAKHGTIYRFDGALTEPSTWKEAFIQMGRESRCDPVWVDDRMKLLYLDSVPPTTVAMDIGPADILMGESGLELSLPRGETDDIINTVKLRYQRRFAESKSDVAYDKLTPYENAESVHGIGDQMGFGVREEPELFFMDLVRSDAMANDLAPFWGNRFAFPANEAIFTGKLPLEHLERGDYLTFELNRSRAKTAVLLHRPLAYFRLADSDLVMRDSSGHAHHGVYSADVGHLEESLTADQNTRSSEFIGTADAAVVDLPFIGTKWTLEVWLKTDISQDSVLIGSEGQLALVLSTTGLTLIWADADLNPAFIQSVGALDDGEVHHVVASHDGIRTAIVVDGVLEAYDDTLSTNPIAAAEWRIGAEIGEAGDYEGFLQDLAIYNRGLSFIRAVKHYETGLNL